MWRPHPVQWLREHPRTADGLLATFVTVITVAAHLFGESPTDGPAEIDPTWWTAALVLVATVPLAWRRIRPTTVALVVVAADVILLFVGTTGAAFLGSIIAVYSVGAHASGPGRTRVMIAIAVMVIALFVAGWIDGLSLVDEFVSTGVTLVTAFVIGDNLRRRRLHVADLAERAERAEREQALLADRRVTAERTRIARDLHDVVAHSVSLMVIQAAAARRSLASSPQEAEQALSTIESTGRRTMTELRSILGVLRDHATTPSLLPQPSLQRLDELLDAGDLPVTLTVDGDVGAVPESVSITTYRLVQEALTNVRRHAGPVAHVEVVVRIDDERLAVTVTDDGRGGAADPSPGGFGLHGMHERVQALGGEVTAGPHTGGGWVVRAELPLSAPSAPVGASVRAETPR